MYFKKRFFSSLFLSLLDPNMEDNGINFRFYEIVVEKRIETLPELLRSFVEKENISSLKMKVFRNSPCFC